MRDNRADCRELNLWGVESAQQNWRDRCFRCFLRRPLDHSPPSERRRPAFPPKPDTGGQYTVKVNPAERRGTVAPGIFGHMVEMIGTTIYDGIWVGEDSSIPNDGGLRLDTIEAYRQLRAPAFRWPGGTIADTYRWKDGIGPRSQRPRILNFWQEVEPNSFGTDEFLRWCAAIGAEPVIQTNIGMGDPSEILAWMEYVNGHSRHRVR